MMNQPEQQQQEEETTTAPTTKLISHLLTIDTTRSSQQLQQWNNNSKSSSPATATNKKNNNNRSGNSVNNSKNDEELNQKLLLLCHFCERDGPTVLFSTQTIHHSLSFSSSSLFFDQRHHNSRDHDDNNQSSPPATSPSSNNHHNDDQNVINVEDSEDDDDDENEDEYDKEDKLTYRHVPIPSHVKHGDNLSSSSSTSSTSISSTRETNNENDQNDDDNSTDGTATYIQQQQQQQVTNPSGLSHRDMIRQILRLYSPQVLLRHISYATLDRNQLFISSHDMKHSQIGKFKSLSLRTLSVEYVGPGREGPVLFGDETTGYTLAYVFKLKDSRARGFTRWYALVLFDKILSCLTLSWSFVQKAFCHVVKCLKKRSQEIFLEENSNFSASSAVSAQVPSSFTTVVPSSFTTNNGGVGSTGVGGTYSGGGGMMDDSSRLTSVMSGHAAAHSLNHRRFNMFNHRSMIHQQQKRTGPLRPLPQLLRHESLFVDLHMWHSSILKAFCDRMIHLAPNDGDDAEHCVDQRQKELKQGGEEEDGAEEMCSSASSSSTVIDSFNYWSIIVKRLIKNVEKQRAKSQLLKSQQQQQQQRTDNSDYDYDFDEEDDSDVDSDGMNIFKSFLLSTAAAATNSNASTAANSSETNAEQRRQPPPVLYHCSVMSHSQIMNTLTYGVLVGRQLIIRSNDLSLANSLCRLYMSLIPDKNVQYVFNAPRFLKSYEANFLTVHSSVPIPQHDIDYHGTVLLDLLFVSQQQQPQQQEYPQLFPPPLSSSLFTAFNPNQPTMTKLQSLNLFHDGTIHETTLGAQIKQLYTKSMVRYKPSSSSERRQATSNSSSVAVPDDLDWQMMEKVKQTEQALIQSLRAEYASKAHVIARGVRSLHSSNPLNEQAIIQRLLHMMNLTMNDLPVVQNFAAASK